MNATVRQRSHAGRQKHLTNVVSLLTSAPSVSWWRICEGCWFPLSHLPSSICAPQMRSEWVIDTWTPKRVYKGHGKLPNGSCSTNVGVWGQNIGRTEGPTFKMSDQSLLAAGQRIKRLWPWSWRHTSQTTCLHMHTATRSQMDVLLPNCSSRWFETGALN